MRGGADIRPGQRVQAVQKRRTRIAVANVGAPERNLRLRGQMVGPGGDAATLRAQRRGIDRAAAKLDRPRRAVGEKLQPLDIAASGQRLGDLIDTGTVRIDHHNLHITGDANNELLPVRHPCVDKQDLRGIRHIRLPQPRRMHVGAGPVGDIGMRHRARAGLACLHAMKVATMMIAGMMNGRRARGRIDAAIKQKARFENQLHSADVLNLRQLSKCNTRRTTVDVLRES